MVQEAIITKLLPDNMAEVAVVRATACGKNCSSCESCIFQNELKVLAKNTVFSKPGHKVLIESKTSSVFGAAVIVYLLPMLTMILGYIIASVLSATETICVAAAFVGLFAGIAIMVLLYRYRRNKTKIAYTIIKELI